MIYFLIHWRTLSQFYCMQIILDYKKKKKNSQSTVKKKNSKL